MINSTKPVIKLSGIKKLIGQRIKTTFLDYNPEELWKNFMAGRRTITNNLNNDLVSLAVYSPDFFSAFNPANEFEKWATVEVKDFSEVPSKMETFILPSGLYAMFPYKGLHTDNSIYQYIFRTWLPGSDYTLDNRPHFEILGSKYKNNDPESEEEIWIPIKPE